MGPTREHDDPATEVVRSSRGARGRRLAAAGVVVALLTAGTLVGSDADFPFGPFRMYATRDDPNGAVVQAVVFARTADGGLHDVTDTPGAPRRAELEGRLSLYEGDPALFARVAPAYRDAVPGVVRVELVRREYRLSGGRRAGTVELPVAAWAVTGR